MLPGHRHPDMCCSAEHNIKLNQIEGQQQRTSKSLITRGASVEIQAKASSSVSGSVGVFEDISKHMVNALASAVTLMLHLKLPGCYMSD